MENIFVEFLPPWIETGLQPAFYDKESGTVLQQTARMYARVNMLIRMFNKLSKNTKTTVEDYITKFNELHDYVQDYFDNLDVQEEINNKMDELVEDGTLQRILNSPATTESLGGVIVGDGLQIDENGKLDVKAGNNITVDENGVSETPYTDYLDISVNKIKYTNDSGCKSWVTYSIIPNTYKPKIICADPSDPNVRKKASDFDFEHTPTLMVNLAPWRTATPQYTYGPLVINHEVKIENNLDGGTGWYRTIMGIKDNGQLQSINGTTEASSITTQYAARCWYTLYNDGATNPDISSSDPREPRTVICQDYDGNYLVFVCGGRARFWDTGMNFLEIVDFVRNTLNWNAKLIFSADGGASSNLLYHGIRQNSPVQNEDRACPVWLVWNSDTARHEGLFKSQSINNEKGLDDIDYGEGHILTWQEIIDNFSGNENVTINAASRIYFPCSRLVVYNLNFTPTATLNDGDIIFDNLPYSNANYYFDATDIVNKTTTQLVLQKDDARQCSVIKARGTINPGRNHAINLSVCCERIW